MFKLVSKMKDLKKVLKELDKDHFSGIEQRFFEAKDNLEKSQIDLQKDPRNEELLEDEKKARIEVL